MSVLPYKPVELVETPVDGQVQAQRVGAPATANFYLGQIVKLVGGNAAPLAGNETTGFFVVVKDNSPGYYPEGSFVDNPDGSWFAAKPNFVDVVPVSGRLVIITARGTLASTHIGASFGLAQDGEYTVLNLAATTTAAATILRVVEGAVGHTNARVLVRLN